MIWWFNSISVLWLDENQLFVSRSNQNTILSQESCTKTNTYSPYNKPENNIKKMSTPKIKINSIPPSVSSSMHQMHSGIKETEISAKNLKSSIAQSKANPSKSISGPIKKMTSLSTLKLEISSILTTSNSNSTMINFKLKKCSKTKILISEFLVETPIVTITILLIKKLVLMIKMVKYWTLSITSETSQEDTSVKTESLSFSNKVKNQPKNKHPQISTSFLESSSVLMLQTITRSD